MKHIAKKQLNRYPNYKRKDKSKKAATWTTPPKSFRQQYNRCFRVSVRKHICTVSNFDDIVLPVCKKIIKWEWW